MKRRRKWQLVPTTCRRCGVSLMTGSYSLTGNEALKAELGSICDKCMTADEKQRLVTVMFGASLADMIDRA